MRRLLLPLALGLLLPSAGRAQGVVSMQGFGYPPGQVSAAALGIGGANAESDPASALNPAGIGMAGRYSVYAHYQPEFRRTDVGGDVAASRAVRFPGFVVTGGFRRLTAGVSFSTLLDRTWTNTYSDSQVVAGDLVPSTLRASSDGAINDSRFALAYVVNARLQVGLAAHAISGENRIIFGRTFPDSLNIGAVTQFSTLSYSGRAVSAGALFQPSTTLLVGVSGRFGGDLDVVQSGVTLARADVPRRIGVGVSYLGIPNTVLAARVDRTSWSDLAPLGTTQVSTFDATEFALGAESAGPRLAGNLTMLRLGYRNRSLPFGVDGDKVSEGALTGGLGIPLARGRSQVDLTVQRARREGGGATERAWLVSIGLGIRP
jgi:hypothetical protein